MKKMILVIFLLFFGAKGFTQAVDRTNKEISIRCCGTPDPTKQPLIVINDKIYPMKLMGGINPNMIDDIKIFKGTEAIQKYGNKAQYGVIVITSKKDAKWVNINSFVKSRTDRKLPMVYNGQVLRAPFIFTTSSAKYTATVLSTDDFHLKDSTVKGKYIAIIETK